MHGTFTPQPAALPACTWFTVRPRTSRGSAITGVALMLPCVVLLAGVATVTLPVWLPGFLSGAAVPSLALGWQMYRAKRIDAPAVAHREASDDVRALLETASFYRLENEALRPRLAAAEAKIDEIGKHCNEALSAAKTQADRDLSEATTRMRQLESALASAALRLQQLETRAP